MRTFTGRAGGRAAGTAALAPWVGGVSGCRVGLGGGLHRGQRRIALRGAATLGTLDGGDKLALAHPSGWRCRGCWRVPAARAEASTTASCRAASAGRVAPSVGAEAALLEPLDGTLSACRGHRSQRTASAPKCLSRMSDPSDGDPRALSCAGPATTRPWASRVVPGHLGTRDVLDWSAFFFRSTRWADAGGLRSKISMNGGAGRRCLEAGEVAASRLTTMSVDVHTHAGQHRGPPCCSASRGDHRVERASAHDVGTRRVDRDDLRIPVRGRLGDHALDLDLISGQNQDGRPGAGDHRGQAALPQIGDQLRALGTPWPGTAGAADLRWLPAAPADDRSARRSARPSAMR